MCRSQVAGHECQVKWPWLCLVGNGEPWEVRSFEEQCEIGTLESILWLWEVIGLQGTEMRGLS